MYKIKAAKIWAGMGEGLRKSHPLSEELLGADGYLGEGVPLSLEIQTLRGCPCSLSGSTAMHRQHWVDSVRESTREHEVGREKQERAGGVGGGEWRGRGGLNPNTLRILTKIFNLRKHKVVNGYRLDHQYSLQLGEGQSQTSFIKQHRLSSRRPPSAAYVEISICCPTPTSSKLLLF